MTAPEETIRRETGSSRGPFSPLADGWNAFWFTPVSSATLAVLRIAFGVVTFLWTLTLGFDLLPFFSRDGLLPAMPHDPSGWDGLWSVLDWFPSDAAVFALYFALLFASAALAIGFRARLAALVVFVALISFQRRNPFMFNSGDVLFRLLALYLFLAPSGLALSLDRWLRARERFWEFPKHAPWVLRLVQLQLCAIYLSTVVAKSAGVPWGDGTAVSYALRIVDHVRFPAPEFVTSWLPLVALMTYGTLLVEIALGTVVWSRTARPYVLALGVLMHLLIDLSLLVGFFSFIMVVAYIAWIPPDTMERTVLRFRDRLARRRGRRRDAPMHHQV